MCQRISVFNIQFIKLIRERRALELEKRTTFDAMVAINKTSLYDVICSSA